jgi:hypothetical protein
VIVRIPSPMDDTQRLETQGDESGTEGLSWVKLPFSGA